MDKRKRTLLTVFLIVFIDLMGFGIVIPLLQYYGEELYHPTPVTLGLLAASYSLMQFIFTPILGRLSDRFGRKPILIFSLAGSVIGYMLFGLQTSLFMLFLSRIIGGIMGGNVSTAQAVIADVTKPEERAKGMGLIGAAFGLGFTLGPAIGIVAALISPKAPGLFAAGLSAIALLLTVFALPETWPAERRVTRVKARSDWFTPHRLWQALRHPQVGLLMGTFFLATFAFTSLESTISLLLKAWELAKNQVYIPFVFLGLIAAFVQGALVGRVVKRYGERRILLAGAICLIPGYILMAIAAAIHHGPMTVGATLLALMAPIVFLALGQGFTTPPLSSLVSRLSTADEQGGILGVYQSMSSLARIGGMFWGPFAFKEFFPSVPYGTAAIVACAVAFFAWLVLARARAAEAVGLHLEVDGDDISP